MQTSGRRVKNAHNVLRSASSSAVVSEAKKR